MTSHGISGDYRLAVTGSRVGFAARHALISKVRGEFNDFEGIAHLDFDDPTNSTAEITIQAASIDTGNTARDEQLRVNEFLDAPTYPSITFTSTAVMRIDDSHFDVTGDLTIKATTRELTLRFELVRVTESSAQSSLRFRASTSINRRDWQVEWPAPLETGGVLVGDKVALVIDVIAINAEAS